MATVDKTWVFSADNEGLADVGNSAVTVAHDTAGNPGGSLEFVGAASGVTERARRATTGQTFETLGVPPGSVVNSLQVISYDYRRWNTSVTSTITARIVGSGAGTVHSSGDLINFGLASGVDGSWVSKGAGTSQAVDSGSQASTTDVRLEVQITLASIDSGFDLGIDNILLRMTYTAGGDTINLGGISSGEALSALNLKDTANLGGIVSSQALSALNLKDLISVGSISSAESLSVLALLDKITLGGVASSEALSPLLLGATDTLNLTGIASAEALSSLLLTDRISLGGIVSAESVSALKLTDQVSLGGVATTENVAAIFQSAMGLQGIVSQEVVPGLQLTEPGVTPTLTQRQTTGYGL